jgi:hypothetical protein
MKLFEPLLGADSFTRATATVIFLTLMACSEKPPPSDAAVKSPLAAPLTNEKALVEGLPEAIKGELALRGDCNMERINGQLFSTGPQMISVNSTIEIAGWVLDVPSGGVPKTVFIRAASADGQRVWYAPAILSVERGDLVSLHGGNDAYRRSGYDTKLKSDALPAGTYRLQIIYAGKSEKAICDNGRTIVIN